MATRNMGDWKQKQRAKKGKGSQTSGLLKGATCQASGIDRVMATRNRSHKYPGYDDWCARKRG